VEIEMDFINQNVSGAQMQWNFI